MDDFERHRNNSFLCFIYPKRGVAGFRRGLIFMAETSIRIVFDCELECTALVNQYLKNVLSLHKINKSDFQLSTGIVKVHITSVGILSVCNSPFTSSLPYSFFFPFTFPSPLSFPFLSIYLSRFRFLFFSPFLSLSLSPLPFSTPFLFPFTYFVPFSYFFPFPCPFFFSHTSLFGLS